MVLLHQKILHVSEESFIKRIYKLIMTIDDNTRNEKLQYNINREVAKLLALTLGKNDKYDILRVIE